VAIGGERIDRTEDHHREDDRSAEKKSNRQSPLKLTIRGSRRKNEDRDDQSPCQCTSFANALSHVE